MCFDWPSEQYLFDGTNVFFFSCFYWHFLAGENKQTDWLSPYWKWKFPKNFQIYCYQLVLVCNYVTMVLVSSNYFVTNQQGNCCHFVSVITLTLHPSNHIHIYTLNIVDFSYFTSRTLTSYSSYLSYSSSAFYLSSNCQLI